MAPTEVSMAAAAASSAAAAAAAGGDWPLLVVRMEPGMALMGSVTLSLIFVFSLHLWKLLGYRDENRDATGTIQRRFLSSVLTCLCSAAMVYSMAQEARLEERGHTFRELLGLSFWSLHWPCIRCLALTAALFLGPIVQHFLAVWMGGAELVELRGSPWMAARNYVVAPLSEEFVFRACLVRLWVAASFPEGAIIFLSPFCFAMAHTHHFVEHVRRHGNKQSALVEVAFQVFYTSLFGMFSNFLLLRTGSLTAVIVAHSFCNHQGFPDLSFMSSYRGNVLYTQRHLIGALYLVGILVFSLLMAPLTAGFDSSFRSAPNVL